MMMEQADVRMWKNKLLNTLSIELYTFHNSKLKIDHRPKCKIQIYKSYKQAQTNTVSLDLVVNFIHNTKSTTHERRNG